jgi:hypothetical protein
MQMLVCSCSIASSKTSYLSERVWAQLLAMSYKRRMMTSLVMTMRCLDLPKMQVWEVSPAAFLISCPQVLRYPLTAHTLLLVDADMNSDQARGGFEAHLLPSIFI